MTKTLSEWLKEAQSADWCLAHFNISSADQLKAIIEVSSDLKSPILIGVSEGEVDFLGYQQTVALINAWRQVVDIPIFLNADHHKSFESAKKAIDAGFDSVNIDLSLLPEEENISISKQVVEYAKGKNKLIDIEGEIGALATQSSEIIEGDVTVDEASLTTPEQAQKYVNETKVDRLTPAVGNFHGMTRKGGDKKLDFARIESIYETVKIPLTLHGGSGTAEADLKRVAALVSNIHINTELRVAYTEGIKLKINETTTPYKYLKAGMEEMKKVVEGRIKLFGSAGKA